MSKENSIESIDQGFTKSDNLSHMSVPKSMHMTNLDNIAVVVPGKRRRFSVQEKLELIRLSYLPGNTVSSVAREYGISPVLLFRWRSLDKAGGLVAIRTGESTVPASQYVEAMDEIKRLQRLLREAMAENALLKDAVKIMRSKK